MAVDKLIEKSTIKFDKPLNLEQIKDLFSHIAKNFNYCIEYNVTEHLRAARIIPVSDLISTNIEATIDAPKFGSASFSCQKPMNDYNSFSSIKFETIPGCELEEHQKGEREIWDNVRKEVEKYFSK